MLNEFVGQVAPGVSLFFWLQMFELLSGDSEECLELQGWFVAVRTRSKSLPRSSCSTIG